MKRTLWPGVASVSVPTNVFMAPYQGAYAYSLSSANLMAGGSIEWIDRQGARNIRQQAAATKAYMKSNGYSLRARSEKFLSRDRVWTADFESTEKSGTTKITYITRLRLTKARKGFVKSELFGQAPAWKAKAFTRNLIPVYNSLQVLGVR
jgi:hypothetical protein